MVCSGYVTWRAARARRELEAARREVRKLRPATAVSGQDTAAELSTDIATLAEQVSALARSEERFRVLVESVTDTALFTLTAAGEVASWNSGAERIFGYREDEIVGRHIRCFYPDTELRAGRPDDLLSVASRSGCASEEGWRLRSDGTRFWGQSTVTVRLGPDCAVAGFAEVARDMSACHEQSEALRQSELRYEAIFHQTAIGMARLDASGHWSDVNEAFCEMLGYSRAEMLDLTVEDITHPADTAATVSRLAGLTSGAVDHYSYEKRYLHKSGHPVWVNIHVATVPASEGRARSYFAFVEDISERRRDQEELERRERQFHSLADNSPDIIARFDRRLECLYVNPAIGGVTGGTPEQFCDCPGDQLALSPERRALLVSALENAFETGCTTTVEVAPRGRAGQCYHTVIVPEKSPDGQVETVLIIGRSVGDLKRVERELRESEERWRLAGRSADLGTFDIDTRSGRVVWSEAAKRHYGLSASSPEPGFDALLSACRAEDRERVRRLMEQAARPSSGGLFVAEYRTIGIEDGRERWLSSRGRVLFDGQGRPTRFLGITLDITDRKRAETALIEGQRRLELALEIAELGTIEIDMARSRVAASARACAIFGFGGPETELPEWLARIHADDRARIAARLRERGSDATHSDLEFRILRPDGGVTWAAARGMALEAGPAAAGRRFSVIQDITRRKESERLLRERGEQAHAILNCIPVKVWTARPDGTTEYRNDRGIEWIAGMGEPPQPLRYSESVHPEDLAPMRARWAESIRTGIPYACEHRYRTPSGEYRWLLAQALPQRDEDGNIVRWFGTVTDIHDQRQQKRWLEDQVSQRTRQLAATVETLKSAESELRASLAEQTVLLQEVHHRVKNNLQVISSLLYMAGQCTADEHAREALRASQQRVQSMSLVHEQLYQSERMTNVDFQQYIPSLAYRILRAFSADDSRIAISTDIDAIPLGIDQAIPCGLILNELVANCFKHAFADGESGSVFIHFKSAGPERETLLSVSNSGRPVPGDVDPLQSKNLGMRIVQILTRQLGGELNFTRAPQTSFSVTFRRQ